MGASGAMSWVDTLTNFPGFRDGFQSGVWAGVIVVVLALVWRVVRSGSEPVPVGLVGAAWVLAALAATDGWWGFRGAAPRPGSWIPTTMIWGLVLLALGAELAARTPNPKIIGVVLAFPAAVVVGIAEDFRGPGWVRPLVIVSITIVAPLAGDLDRRAARLGLGPVLWLVSVIGVYATVPDTELVRPLVGVAVPLALVGWPLRLGRLGAGGAAAGVGLLVWIGALEGYGRPGSIVGTVGALGLFAVEPVGRALFRHRIVPLSRTLSVAAFGVAFVLAHVLMTWYGSRVAGFARTGGGATALMVPAIPVGVVIGGVLGLSRRRTGGPRPRRRRSTRPAPPPTAGPPPR